MTKWLQKYASVDWENRAPTTISKTPEEKIIGLEAKVRLLEKQKARTRPVNSVLKQEFTIASYDIDL